MSKLPWHDPEQLLGAWTPPLYQSAHPPFVNATQVGSMVRVTVRGDDGFETVTFNVNLHAFATLAAELKNAADKFEPGLSERIFDEHQKKGIAEGSSEDRG